MITWDDIVFGVIPDKEEVLRMNREERERKKREAIGQMNIAMANPPVLAPLPDDDWDDMPRDLPF